MNISLNETDYRALVELLGASEGVFGHVASESKGILARSFTTHEQQCKRFIEILTSQFNEQFANAQG